MKVKKYLSVWAMVCAGALTLAGCSDYDNGYNENAIKFQEAFKETFGDIDPEQDWNLAERATVTVNTQTESNIKIYALEGGEYSIVGDYEGVKGTRMLGVDVIEGTRNLLVSDGRTAQKCAPGDVVVFGQMNTRTVYEGSTPIGNNQYITVTKLTGNVTDLGDDKTYLQYRTSTQAEVQGMLNTIPQGVNNLSKPEVKHNFTYVSTGSFIVYPFYWYTSSLNTLGLYYKDNNNVEHWVPIIKPNDLDANGTNELWYKEGDRTYLASDNMVASSWNRTLVDPNTGEWIEGNPAGNWQTQSKYMDDQNDDSGVRAAENSPFLEVWTAHGEDLGTQTIYKDFANDNFTPGSEILVEVKARLAEQEDGKSSVNIYDYVGFKANGQTVSMTYDASAVRTTHNSWGILYPNMGGGQEKKMWVICKVDDQGKIRVEFNLRKVKANWFSFKDLKFYKLNSSTHDEAARGHEFFPTNGGVKGQGIRVDIPEGIQFSIYLDKTDANGTYRIYSDGKMNESDLRLWKTETEVFPTCYASTFYVGEQMFIGFEDWPGTTGGDYDLNDMVFTFDGKKPIIINEDPTSKAWMLACEDLGGTFDRDYNDVVFKVEHISGKTTATVTPLAAGGTLASYIFHVPESGSEQCLGEIHQLFGFEPEVSGEYEAHNAGVSRGTEGATVTINVPENWSMAYYSTNTFGTGTESYQNMGGFEIRTLPKGTEAPQTTNWTEISTLSSGASRIPAPDMGAAPYIICFPYSYVENNKPSVGQKTETFWAWPQEFMTIDGCYPDFPGWVSNHSDRTYGTWYQRRKDNAPTVSELKIVTTSGGSPALLPSQLGHDKETIEVVKNSSGYYDVNSYEDLRANLTGVTSGTLSYFYIDTDGNEQPLDANAHLYNGGPRTIIVKQAEDGTYAAGQTQFTLYINDLVTKTDPDFGTQTSIIQGGNWTNWSTGSGDRTINMTAGEDLWIGGILNGTTGTYVGTLKSFSTGGTNSTCSQWESKPGEYRVYTDPNVGGTMKVVLHYDGNDQYNAKDITITINTTKTVKFVHNNLALSYVNGSLQMKTVTDDAAWTNFQKWRLISANKGDGFYFLYNVGANKYLRIGETKNDAGTVISYFVEWVDSPNKDAQQERFLLTSEGYLGSLRRSQYGRYLGSTQSWEDGAVINSPDAQGNAIINWTIQNTASAKKRM